MRISSGSSTATASRSVAPAGRRTTSTDALEYGGASTAPRSLRLVERAAAGDDVVEHRPVAVDRSGDVTRPDVALVLLDELRDLARSEELGDDLALIAFPHDGIGELVPGLLEHALEQPVELRQGLRRVLAELVLER